MSKRTTEIASGAVREIEPELRELFTKVVERDPREAVKMLEPYPDEFVVKMLELLNPAATLKILQRFDLSRRETILATLLPKQRSSGCGIKLIRNVPLGGSYSRRWQFFARQRPSAKLQSKFGGSPEKRLSPTPS